MSLDSDKLAKWVSVACSRLNLGSARSNLKRVSIVPKLIILWCLSKLVAPLNLWDLQLIRASLIHRFLTNSSLEYSKVDLFVPLHSIIKWTNSNRIWWAAARVLINNRCTKQLKHTSVARGVLDLNLASRTSDQELLKRDLLVPTLKTLWRPDSKVHLHMP